MILPVSVTTRVLVMMPLEIGGRRHPKPIKPMDRGAKDEHLFIFNEHCAFAPKIGERLLMIGRIAPKAENVKSADGRFSIPGQSATQPLQ